MSAEILVSCPVRQRRAVHWAQRMLIPGNAVILDTETIDLGADICEIAVIDTNGNTLLDTLVNPDPRGCWMHPDALRVHGISNDMLREAPGTRPVLQQLAQVVAGRHVLAYNARMTPRSSPGQPEPRVSTSRTWTTTTRGAASCVPAATPPAIPTATSRWAVGTELWATAWPPLRCSEPLPLPTCTPQPERTTCDAGQRVHQRLRR